MSPSFYSVVHAIGAFFNVTIREEKGHAWFEIERNVKVLVAIVDDEPSLLLSISLGVLPEYFPKDILVQILISNQSISLLQGPRFSYLENSNTLAITDSVETEDVSEENICLLIDSLITVACEMKNTINELGYTLSIRE